MKRVKSFVRICSTVKEATCAVRQQALLINSTVRGLSGKSGEQAGGRAWLSGLTGAAGRRCFLVLQTQETACKLSPGVRTRVGAEHGGVENLRWNEVPLLAYLDAASVTCCCVTHCRWVGWLQMTIVRYFQWSYKGSTDACMPETASQSESAGARAGLTSFLRPGRLSQEYKPRGSYACLYPIGQSKSHDQTTPLCPRHHHQLGGVIHWRPQL